MVLPAHTHLQQIGQAIIQEAELQDIAERVGGVEYEGTGSDCGVTDESNFLVNRWLIRHMDKFPLYKVCYC